MYEEAFRLNPCHVLSRKQSGPWILRPLAPSTSGSLVEELAGVGFLLWASGCIGFFGMAGDVCLS